MGVGHEHDGLFGIIDMYGEGLAFFKGGTPTRMRPASPMLRRRWAFGSRGTANRTSHCKSNPSSVRSTGLV